MDVEAGKHQCSCYTMLCVEALVEIGSIGACKTMNLLRLQTFISRMLLLNGYAISDILHRTSIWAVIIFHWSHIFGLLSLISMDPTDH